MQLKERARIALAGVDRVFTAQPDFDPASSRREFCLLVSDYTIAVIGDTVARLLAREAPHTRLRYTANTPDKVEAAERSLATADLMIIPHGFISDVAHRDLYRDDWVCIVSADNADVGTDDGAYSAVRQAVDTWTRFGARFRIA